MELLFDPSAWASLITLTVLEIVLGIDNIVVLSILTHALPEREAQRARAAGLGLALALRLVLLFAITWIIHLTYPVFSAAGRDFSWRDLILIAGGLFLMVKATQEIHAEIEGRDQEDKKPQPKAKFGAVISQIAVMDLVFSLDSIITAVGLAQHIEVMVAAICIAIAVMYVAAQPVSAFIKRHPAAKMLGLSFLILIGVALIADGFEIHIPRGYIYFSMAFAAGVEALNIWAARSRKRQSAGPGVPAADKPLARPNQSLAAAGKKAAVKNPADPRTRNSRKKYPRK